MYGVQVDQLAVLLAVSEVRARALVSRWRERGHAESARLGPGRPWVWLTRDGLLACGLPYRPAPPALARLAHLRAVTAVRMALESAPGYLAAGAYWRSERRLRARMGSRVPLREHLPDGEVHWPDPDGPDQDPRAPDGSPGATPPWPASAGPSRRNSPARPCAGPRPSWPRSSPGPATTAARPRRSGSRGRRRGTRGCCTCAHPRPGPPSSGPVTLCPGRWPRGWRSGACPRAPGWPPAHR